MQHTHTHIHMHVHIYITGMVDELVEGLMEGVFHELQPRDKENEAPRDFVENAALTASLRSPSGGAGGSVRVPLRVISFN